MDTQIISEQEIAEALDKAISGNRVMLFMKGTPERPMCGFSMRVIQSLRDVDADFAAMDILPDPRIRQVLSARSGWPTIPQLFVEGELVGGCDIVDGAARVGRAGEDRQVPPPRQPDTRRRCPADPASGSRSRSTTRTSATSTSACAR